MQHYFKSVKIIFYAITAEIFSMKAAIFLAIAFYLRDLKN